MKNKHLYLEYPKTKKYKEFKTCIKCKVPKHYTEFYMTLDKDGYIKITSECIPCTKIRNRKEKYKSLYGCSLEEINNLFSQSNGKCAICGVILEFPKYNKEKTKNTMHIDHCHKTNKVRGILCHNCNVGLGNFKDNPEILLSAVKYLYGH